MTTAIYARISDDREGHELGVDRQLEDCRRLVETGDAQEYVDSDVSASRFTQKKRPGYQQMLEGVKAGQIDTIICYKLSRLYRRPRELEELIALVEGGRLRVRVVEMGVLDRSTSHGRTIARIIGAIDAQASEDTSERVKRQKQQAKEQGRLLGGPRAFGWRSEPVKDGGGIPVLKSNGKVQMQLVPVPAEVKAIREAVSRLLKGQSLNNVADLWNERAIPTPQGKRDRKRNPEGAKGYQGRWTPQTVKNVMSNRRHAGPVIKPQRFDQLQALLARRAGFRVPRRRSLLTGLVRCAECGHTMVRSGAEGQRTLRCSKPLGGCGRVTVNYAGLEALLVEATLQRADTGVLARILRSMNNGGEQDGIMRQLEELSRQEDELSESFGANRLPITAFEKATAAIEGERKALQVKLSRVASSFVIAPYASKPGALQRAWPTMTLDQQREVIQIVLGKVEVTPTPKRGLPRFDPKRVRISRR